MPHDSLSDRKVASDDVNAMMAASLNLEVVRAVRRLTRCGLLVLIAAVVGTFIHGLSLVARCGSIALLASAPILAWIVEVRLALRLGRHRRQQKVVRSR
jgi:hypothetical protein